MAQQVLPSPEQVRIATWITMVAVVADYLAVGVMRTLLPYYAKTLGGNTTLIGGLETAYGIGQVVGAVFMGRLSDRLGRRAVMIISFSGSAIGYSMAACARGPGMLIASRLPVGLAKQTVTVSRAILADCTTPGARSAQMSRLTAAMSLGYSLGPFFGAMLADWAGNNAVPAAAAAGMFVCLIPFVWFFLPETSPGRAAGAAAGDGGGGGSAGGGTEGGARREAGLVRQWDVVGPLLLLSVPELALVLHTTTTLTGFVLHELGKEKQWLGSLGSLQAVLQSLCSAFMLPALSGWGDSRVLQLGYGLFALASLIIYYTASAEGAIISVVPASVAISIMRSTPASYMSKRVGGDQQGEVLGLLDAFYSLCRVIGPLSIGIIMDRYGVASGFLVQAGLYTVGLLSVRLLQPPGGRKDKRE